MLLLMLSETTYSDQGRVVIFLLIKYTVSLPSEGIGGKVLYRWIAVWPWTLRTEPRVECTVLLFFPVKERRSDTVLFRTDILCDHTA